MNRKMHFGARSRSYGLLVAMGWVFLTGVSALAAEDAVPAYKNRNLPVDERVKDLIGRMTLEEKARQLDMYNGCEDLVDKKQTIDNHTHAKPDAVFDPQFAEKNLGNLGAGSIHDLYPKAKLYNTVQAWVIKSSRLGIPALFIEEGLHGYMSYDQTVFPQSINLATTWNLELA
jgi:beta-glucosidase